MFAESLLFVAARLDDAAPLPREPSHTCTCDRPGSCGITINKNYCVRWVWKCTKRRKEKMSASFIVFKELHYTLITVKTNRLSPHVIVQAYN